MTQITSKALVVFIAAALIASLIVSVVKTDKRERQLISGGHCWAVTEVLYTPPPRATTSCFGSNPPICSTSIFQGDPYFRTLWRCKDPDRAGRSDEFWRRSIGDERAEK